MKILAHLQNMARSEILEMINAAKYSEIIERDPHPQFQAYVVGEEGGASGRIVGLGRVASQWLRSAIIRLNDLLKIGTKVFHGHDTTNSHANRTPIGEVVGKAIKKIGDKISSVAVIHRYPEFRDLPLDVASVEADVTSPANSRNVTYSDEDIKSVTGVALGNSSIDRPAFPGAIKLAEMQAFQIQHTTGGNDMTTKAEIKTAISELGLNPSDLFTIGILSEDPLFKSYIKEEKSNEYNARKRNLDEFQKERDKWAEKEAEFEKKIKINTKATLKIAAREKITAEIEKRKLSDEQKKYIEPRVDTFDPNTPETLDSDIGKFIDKSIDELDKTAVLLGVKKETKEDDGKTGNGVGARKTDEELEKDEDYVNPEKNDFIPE